MVMTLIALGLREGGDIVIGGSYDSSKATPIPSPGDAGRSYWNNRFECGPAHPSGFVICCANQCAGVYAIYRISFVLCLFFAFLMLCTIGSTRFSARAHRGFWFPKLFLILTLLVCTVFVDNDAMSAYRDFTRVASGFYLVVQTVMLIDFGYTMNDWLVGLDEKFEVESPYCNFRVLTLFLAVCLYAISITLWALTGGWFGGDGCGWNQATLSFSILISVFLSLVSCTSKIAPHGTLLTSAVITAYASYLTYSALSSRPAHQGGGSCNPFDKADSTYSWSDLLMGMAIYTISMGSTAVSAARLKPENIAGQAPSAAGVANDDLTVTIAGTSSSSDGNDKGGSGGGDDETAVAPEQWWWYHLMMVISACYMSMLCSDWASNPSTDNLSISSEAFAVKAISCFGCLAIYGWTLLAPYLLRDYRDFGVEFDD